MTTWVPSIYNFASSKSTQDLKASSQSRSNRNRTRRANTSRNRRNRRLSAMRLSSPRNRSSSRLLTRLLRLHQHRNHSTSIQLESPVSQDPQNRRNLTRMRSNRNKRLLLRRRAKENLTQRRRTSNILRATSLRRHAIPQLILFAETLLNGPRRE